MYLCTVFVSLAKKETDTNYLQVRPGGRVVTLNRRQIQIICMWDKVAEWLRRWTANPLCSARMGSNPILVGLHFFTFKTYISTQTSHCKYFTLHYLIERHIVYYLKLSLLFTPINFHELFWIHETKFVKCYRNVIATMVSILKFLVKTHGFVKI